MTHFRLDAIVRRNSSFHPTDAPSQRSLQSAFDHATEQPDEPRGAQGEVIICYRTEDVEVAQDLRDLLADAKVPATLLFDLEPGGVTADRVLGRIREAIVAIVLVRPHAEEPVFGDGYREAIARLIERRDVSEPPRIVPLKIGCIGERQVEYGLIRLHPVELKDEGQLVGCIKTLTDVCRSAPRSDRHSKGWIADRLAALRDVAARARRRRRLWIIVMLLNAALLLAVAL